VSPKQTSRESVCGYVDFPLVLSNMSRRGGVKSLNTCLFFTYQCVKKRIERKSVWVCGCFPLFQIVYLGGVVLSH